MCFDAIGTMKVAKEDIVCYKFITKGNNSIHFLLRVNRRHEKWEKGYHYMERRFPKHKDKYDSITKYAFHSFRSVRSLRVYYNAGWNISHDCKIIECIIPKGTKYYANRTQYCSSDIIYQKDYRSKTRKNA